MKKNIVVTLSQVWSTELAHEIGKGFYEYTRRGVAWEIQLIDYRQVMDHIKNWKMGALVIPVAPEGPTFDQLASLDIPLVSTHYLPEHLEIPQVDVDSAATGRLAAEFLLDRGYRRFATFTGFRGHQIELRSSSFAEAIQDRIPEATVAPFFMAPQLENLAEWMKAVPKPGAVFCSDDATARKLIKAAQEAHMEIPGDIAILGCENDMMVCEGIRPMISSVQLPYRKVGYEAARLLDLLLQGKQEEARQTILLPPESIVERMSTSTLATTDEQLRRAVDYIHGHFHEETMSIATAARHAGLSLRILQMRFKKELGHTPVHYLQRVRLENAKKLLRTSRMSMEEVAEAVGYGNGNYLSKAFSSVIGQSARAYRKSFQA